jgi:hypothetical protein
MVGFRWDVKAVTSLTRKGQPKSLIFPTCPANLTPGTFRQQTEDYR